MKIINKKTIMDISKKKIVEEIFTEFPTDSLLDGDNAYDVFVGSDDLSWEYTPKEVYEEMSTDEIRDMLEEMLEKNISFAQDLIEESELLAEENKNFAEFLSSQGYTQEAISNIASGCSSKVTKIIRLEWSDGDGVTFEDFKVSSSAPKEVIQHCINIALRCREDECEKFKIMMHKKGYFCEYHRPVIEVYDFNTKEV